MSAAISELRAEVAQTNAIYRELTKQPIIIKVGDKTIKKHVNQELGTKVTRLVAANAAALSLKYLVPLHEWTRSNQGQATPGMFQHIYFQSSNIGSNTYFIPGFSNVLDVGPFTFSS